MYVGTLPPTAFLRVAYRVRKYRSLRKETAPAIAVGARRNRQVGVADTAQTIRGEDPDMGPKRAIWRLDENRRQCDAGDNKAPNSAGKRFSSSDSNRPLKAVTAVQIRSGVLGCWLVWANPCLNSGGNSHSPYVEGFGDTALQAPIDLEGPITFRLLQEEAAEG